MEDPRGRRVLPYNRLHFSQQVFSLHDYSYDEDPHLKKYAKTTFLYVYSFCDIESLLMLPTEEQVGPSRLPNLSYASDHIAIACDVKIH